ncbi:MAG: acyl-CoA dehydrogenase family protein [Acidimicrobiales bacterium]
MTLTNDAAAAVAPLDPAVVHAGIEALLPRIAEGAAAADRNRRVDDEVARGLRDAGAHRFLQPAAYGGAESSVVDHVRAVARVAEGCAAAGWCLAVWSVHNWMLAHYDAATQAEVWGADPTAVISGSIVPKTPFPDDGDGHVLVRGRFGFASGGDHADWLLVGGLVARDGRPTPCQTIVPAGATRLDHDSWQVMALRGTGSKDFEVDPAWPVRRDGVLFTADIATWTAPGQQVNRGWLYQGPYKPVALLVLAPPALGAAKAALSRFIERMGSHFLPLSGLVQRNDPAARLRVAESAAEIDAAERTLLAAAARCDELGRRPDRDPLAEETVCRDATFAVRLCARAVDRLFEAAGGSALQEGEPLARLWRDVHGARIHAALTWDAAAHNFANALLGPAGA